MPKRKFGVSLEEGLARELDRLAAELRVERSQLVEAAVRALVREYSHALSEHECRALLALSCPAGREVQISHLEGVHMIHFHQHEEGRCLHLVLLSGNSSRISALLSSLPANECEVRLLALH